MELTEEEALRSARWLNWVQRQEAYRARTWRYAWTAINGGLAVASFGLLPLSSRDKDLELIVSGVGSTASTLFTVLWPLKVEASLDRPFDGDAPCRALEQEERFVAVAAADEASRVTWEWHGVNLIVGGIYTAIVGLGTHRWDAAVIDGLSAFAIGETQTLTQPTRLARTASIYVQVEPYKTGYLGSFPSHSHSLTFRLVSTF